MRQLGSLEDLPEEFLTALEEQNLSPLWPALRALMPGGRPEQKTAVCHWRYDQLRPLLMQAGSLAPIEKAERRVLVLNNPGLDPDNPAATPVIYLGMQLILPGEIAPNHKHSPSAVRLVVEGTGAYTSVSGDRLPMSAGDLILTPAGEWHEHGHDGSGPVVWLDALDMPLIRSLGAAYALEGNLQNASDDPDRSQTHYTNGGLLPYDILDKPKKPYPQMRFPWKDARESLERFSPQCEAGKGVRLAYVNPETGQECLPVIGFSALMVRPGETVNLVARSCATVMHVVGGNGDAKIGSESISGWATGDSFVQPGHDAATISNASANNAAFLVLIDEAPLHRKIGIYEEYPTQR